LGGGQGAETRENRGRRRERMGPETRERGGKWEFKEGGNHLISLKIL